MKCKKPVGNGVVTFGCIVDIPSGLTEHPGPCAANEVAPSLAARRQWEEQQEAARILAETQGAPQTFHQANGTTGTPVPGSSLQPQEYREVHRPAMGEFEQRTECQHPYAFITQNDDGSTVCRSPGCGLILEEPNQKAESSSEAAQSVQADTNLKKAVGDMALQGLSDPLVEAAQDWSREQIAQEVFAEGMDSGLSYAEATEDAWPSEEPVDQSQPGVPTKQRPGDQPLPTSDPSDPCVQDAIIEMMEESKRVGIERYGQTLHTFNGRDCLRDAHEEARDGLVYLTALQMERDVILHMFERLASEVISALPARSTQDIDFILAWLRGEPT